MLYDNLVSHERHCHPHEDGTRHLTRLITITLFLVDLLIELFTIPIKILEWFRIKIQGLQRHNYHQYCHNNRQRHNHYNQDVDSHHHAHRHRHHIPNRHNNLHEHHQNDHADIRNIVYDHHHHDHDSDDNIHRHNHDQHQDIQNNVHKHHHHDHGRCVIVNNYHDHERYEHNSHANLHGHHHHHASHSHVNESACSCLKDLLAQYESNLHKQVTATDSTMVLTKCFTNESSCNATNFDQLQTCSTSKSDDIKQFLYSILDTLNNVPNTQEAVAKLYTTLPEGFKNNLQNVANPTDLSTMLQKLTQETVAKGTSDDINGDNKAEEEKRKLKEEESDKSVDDFELE